MNATGTGIGRALRTARESRGMSLEEASRDTRIRAEYLQALEREAFDRLLGDVYVRGFLRSYSTYLGLDAERVVGAYARAYGHHEPTTPPPPSVTPTVSSSPEGHPLIHRRANWPLAIGLAAAMLVIVSVVALSARSGAPAGLETDPPPPPTMAAPAPPVVVNVLAHRPVEAWILEDGVEVFNGTLARGEARSFEADEAVSVKFSDAGAVTLSVNGRNLGIAGDPGVPYENQFAPDDYRSSPSTGG